jgi:hypothetical protein
MTDALAKVGAVMFGLPGPLAGITDIRKDYFDAIRGPNIRIVESPTATVVAITPGMESPPVDLDPMMAGKRKAPEVTQVADKAFLRQRNAARRDAGSCAAKAPHMLPAAVW